MRTRWTRLALLTEGTGEVEIREKEICEKWIYVYQPTLVLLHVLARR